MDRTLSTEGEDIYLAGMACSPFEHLAIGFALAIRAWEEKL